MRILAIMLLGIAVGYLTLNYRLPYFFFGILIGLGVILINFLHAEEQYNDLKSGYISVLIGTALLIATFFITKSYGITFEELAHNKTFSRYARYLPGLSITFLTIGAFTVIKSISNRS